jgi:hypothetical protein
MEFMVGAKQGQSQMPTGGVHNPRSRTDVQSNDWANAPQTSRGVRKLFRVIGFDSLV